MNWPEQSIELIKISNMPNSKPKLSIIVVNYRSEQYLENCVASVFKRLKNINFEIIVVNNNNLDIQCPSGARIINVGKNIGFGAGCNLGVKNAQGRYLLFLNPDTEILSGNLANILNKFKEDQTIGAIGPRLTMENGETQWWCAGKEFSLWRLIKNNLGIIESKKIWESKTGVFADWVSGAALVITKKIFDNIGGFDENFFMYFEDEDLCKRIRKRGYKVLYYPETSVLHKGGKSRRSFLRQKLQFFKSLFFYVKKG